MLEKHGEREHAREGRRIRRLMNIAPGRAAGCCPGAAALP